MQKRFGKIPKSGISKRVTKGTVEKINTSFDHFEETDKVDLIDCSCVCNFNTSHKVKKKSDEKYCYLVPNLYSTLKVKRKVLYFVHKKCTLQKQKKAASKSIFLQCLGQSSQKHLN